MEKEIFEEPVSANNKINLNKCLVHLKPNLISAHEISQVRVFHHSE